MNDAARRLSRYFLFQTILNAGFGVIIAIGLWFIGIPSPFLCGALAGLLRFVPYVGSFIGATVPIALAAAVAPGWTAMLEVAALFVIIEPIVGQVIEPLLYGHQTGISPIAVVVGPGGIASLNAAYRLPRRARPACGAPWIPRRALGQRAGADAGGKLLPAPARGGFL
jgi:predicted PurR-regulated permease PerM